MDNSLIWHVWKEESKSMDEDDFVHEIKEFSKCIDRYKPMYVIGDHRHFHYVVMLSTFRVVNELVHKKLYQYGVKKVAFLVSADMLANVSLTESVSGGYASRLNIRFFDDIHQAYQWLGIGSNVLEQK